MTKIERYAGKLGLEIVTLCDDNEYIDLIAVRKYRKNPSDDIKKCLAYREVGTAEPIHHNNARFYLRDNYRTVKRLCHFALKQQYQIKYFSA
jgi:hypothetical protein